MCRLLVFAPAKKRKITYVTIATCMRKNPAWPEAAEDAVTRWGCTLQN